MRSWLVGQPYEIIIITTFAVLPALQELADEMNREDAEKNPEMVKDGLVGRDGKGRVRVFGVEKANKRKQMVEGIKRTETDIIVSESLLTTVLPPTSTEMTSSRAERCRSLPTTMRCGLLDFCLSFSLASRISQ